MQSTVTIDPSVGELCELGDLAAAHAAAAKNQAAVEQAAARAAEADKRRAAEDEGERRRIAAARKIREVRDREVKARLDATAPALVAAFEAWEKPKRDLEQLRDAIAIHQAHMTADSDHETAELRRLCPAAVRLAIARLAGRRDERSHAARQALEALAFHDGPVDGEIARIQNELAQADLEKEREEFQAQAAKGGSTGLRTPGRLVEFYKPK